MEIHNRHSIRLKGWDYSNDGAYFVTICTKNMECILGEIIDGKIVLNDVGKMAQEFWLKIPNYFKNVKLDECIIMPNHVHGIIIIDNDNSAGVIRLGVNRCRGAINRTPTTIDAQTIDPTKNSLSKSSAASHEYL